MIHNKKIIFIIFLFSLFSGMALAKTIKCSYCKKPITGKYIIYEKHKYHQNCYEKHVQPRCDYCNKVLDGKYNVDGKKKYHPNCYTNHILDKCDICNKPLEGGYFTDFWDNSYHAKHSKQYHACSVCNRLITDKLTNGGIKIVDRYICTQCDKKSVNTKEQVRNSFKCVYNMLQSVGIENIPKTVPILLIDKQKQLRKLAKTNSDKLFGFTENSVETINGKVVSKEYTISILSHLPPTVFEAVLAHELLHVYLFEKELKLRSKITEGFCNLGSEMVYKNSRSELANYKLQSMQEDKDPDYGAGYRKMSKYLKKNGWEKTLKNLKKMK